MPFNPGLLVVMGNVERVIIAWWGGMINQSHPRLLRSSTCLTTIARYTGTNHIFPGMYAALKSWDDMVYSELPTLFATILASVLVPIENFKAS